MSLYNNKIVKTQNDGTPDDLYKSSNPNKTQYHPSAPSGEVLPSEEPQSDDPNNILRILRESKRAVLNVGGVRHEVMWKTLERLPRTRLAKLRNCKTLNEISTLCDDFYPYIHGERDDGKSVEFFFDRQAASFGSVLNFYRTGKLHMADQLCVQSFSEDLVHWGLDELYLDACCRYRYHKLKETAFEELKKEASSLKVTAVEDFGTGKVSVWRKRIWDLMEKPHSSILARVIWIMSILIIWISTIVLMLKTLPMFMVYHVEEEFNHNILHITEADPFVMVEGACIGWFILEYIIRFWASPNKLVFLKSPLNMIDLLAILPYLVSVILDHIFEGTVHILALVITIVRMMRILRILKLVRHFTGLQSLAYTILKSYKEISLLTLFMAIGVVIFSTLVYYAEFNTGRSNFNSIPDAFWWAIITMSTVGYGDQIPVTIWGKVIGSMCAITGMLCIVLPIPVIYKNFGKFYDDQMRQGIALKRREAMARSKESGSLVSVNLVFESRDHSGQIEDQKPMTN